MLLNILLLDQNKEFKILQIDTREISIKPESESILEYALAYQGLENLKNPDSKIQVLAASRLPSAVEKAIPILVKSSGKGKKEKGWVKLSGWVNIPNTEDWICRIEREWKGVHTYALVNKNLSILRPTPKESL
jgi:hypothetical protein